MRDTRLRTQEIYPPMDTGCTEIQLPGDTVGQDPPGAHDLRGRREVGTVAYSKCVARAELVEFCDLGGVDHLRCGSWDA